MTLSDQRRVLVTGASGAIGAAIATVLAQMGFDVGVHAHRNRAKAQALAERLQEKGQQAHVLSFDVTDRERTQQVLADEIQARGSYWGIVLNAGMAADNSFPALSDGEWDRVLDTNLDGFYNVLHPLIMPLIRQRRGGRIITMASVAGLVGNRGQVNYSAAKAGLIGASKALAVELASRGITVNCVAPGLIDTDMVKPDVLDKMLDYIPMRRAGTPQDVAELVGFLMSDKAGYMTRQVLSVNGGLC